MRPSDEELQAIAESLTLDGTLEEVGRENDVALAADPEWADARHHHIQTLMTAFAVGVLEADPYYQGYRLPPDFSAVVDLVADRVARHFPGQEVPVVSLVEMKALYTEWASEHPAFLAWNETDVLVGITHRYSAVPTERQFIDLGALVHQACLFLRESTRRADEFDRRFEAEHGELS